jgi:conjugal transfer pilus assembly protein TraW
MAYLLMFMTVATIDLGIQGKTFPIAERNLKEVMAEKVAQVDEMPIKETERRLRSPKAVSGLGVSQRKQRHTFDPSVVAHEEIKDNEGNVIVAKGSRYNPLDRIQLNENLLFFSAANREHIAWAEVYPKKAKWILVEGDPFLLESELDRPVFFDQFGYLTKKLGIKNVPAVVYQEGNLLVIEEIPLLEGFDG